MTATGEREGARGRRAMGENEARGRVQTIERWLASVGHVPREVEALPGDISLRRYFRARFVAGGTAIVAYYPIRLRAVCRRFRTTTDLFVTAGVPVPRVLAADCRRGMMLVEDVGTRTLYDEKERAWDSLAPIYRTATEYVRRIQRLPQATIATLNPRLDAALLRWELRKSWELVLVPNGLAGDEETARELALAFDALCAQL